MIIKKILNNNVIISLDSAENEVIAMGKGIAYNKKNGDEIEADKINKLFTLHDTKSQEIEKFITEIPIEYIEVSYEIADFATKNYQLVLREGIYLSLADHIYSSIQRYKEGITLNNIMLWDIKRFYPNEFEIGIKSLTMIADTIGIQLPIDEAGFIAFHLVESELDNESQGQVQSVTRVIHELSNIVKYHFKIDYNENSIYYVRFITHLKFFAQRMLTGRVYETDDNGLLAIITEKYPAATKCIHKIDHYLKEHYQFSLNDEEKLYLTVHIQRVIEESK